MNSTKEKMLKEKFAEFGISLPIKELDLTYTANFRIRGLFGEKNATLEDLLKIPKVYFMQKHISKEIDSVLSVLGLSLKESKFSTELNPRVKLEKVADISEKFLSKKLAKYLTKKGYETVGKLLKPSREKLYVEIGKERYQELESFFRYDKYEIFSPNYKELKRVNKDTPIEELPLTHSTKRYILEKLGYKNLDELLNSSKEEVKNNSTIHAVFHNISEIEKLLNSKNWKW